MDIYERIIEIKKIFKLNNKDMGGLINKSGDTFRKALSRKSLNDFEIKSLAKSLASLNLHNNEKERLMIEELLNEIRRKINKNRTNVRHKLLTESDEENLIKGIKEDPEYKDMFNEPSPSYVDISEKLENQKITIDSLQLNVKLLKEENERLKKELSSTCNSKEPNYKHD